MTEHLSSDERIPSQTSHNSALQRISVVRVMIAAFAASLLASLVMVMFGGIERDLAGLSEQIVLTVFVESGTSAKDLATAQSDLKTIAGIDSVSVQSASEVKEAFSNRFATNIGSVLPENAFPTALIVRLKEDFRTKERIDSIVSSALGMQSISNVSYRTAFVEAVEKRQTQEYTVLWVVSCVVALAVFILLWQALSGIPLRLQESAGAVLAGVIIAMIIGLALFANLKHLFPWLESIAFSGIIKFQLLGSVAVCALATCLLAVQTVRRVIRHEEANKAT